jgi:hypothetical protein
MHRILLSESGKKNQVSKLKAISKGKIDKKVKN